MTYKPPTVTYKPSITTPKSAVVAAKPSYYVLPSIYRTVFVYVEPLTNLAMLPALLFAHRRLLAFFVPLVALELDASSLDFIFFNPITRYLILLLAAMFLLFAAAQYVICQYSVSTRPIVALMTVALAGDASRVWATIDANKLMDQGTEFGVVLSGWAVVVWALVLATARVGWFIEVALGEHIGGEQTKRE